MGKPGLLLLIAFVLYKMGQAVFAANDSSTITYINYPVLAGEILMWLIYLLTGVIILMVVLRVVRKILSELPLAWQTTFRQYRRVLLSVAVVVGCWLVWYFKNTDETVTSFLCAWSLFSIWRKPQLKSKANT